MKNLIPIFLLFVFSSCIQYNGIQIVSKPYVLKKEWKDTVIFRKKFDLFKFENSKICLDSIVIKKIVENFRDPKLEDSSIYSPTSWYPKITCEFDKNLYPCLYSWYLITEDKNLIFELGLFESGLCIWHIKNFENDKYVVYNPSDLNKNKKFKKMVIKRFETEILPKLKPYFKDFIK